MTGNTIECDKRFEPGTDINVYVLLRKQDFYEEVMMIQLMNIYFIGAPIFNPFQYPQTHFNGTITASVGSTIFGSKHIVKVMHIRHQ